MSKKSLILKIFKIMLPPNLRWHSVQSFAGSVGKSAESPAKSRFFRADSQLLRCKALLRFFTTLPRTRLPCNKQYKYRGAHPYIFSHCFAENRPRPSCGPHTEKRPPPRCGAEGRLGRIVQFANRAYRRPVPAFAQSVTPERAAGDWRAR